ncbi:Peptidase family U32 [uncultured archaeon]|nr:Peptidase family U32 [uncultured archaeon]
MKPKYELLAPVGNFAMLRAAVDAGADAIFFGLKNFNMRAGAKNFEVKDLDEINKICKPKGVKKYLTLNIIIYPEEVKKVDALLKKIKNKVDAIICWDFSVINLCKKHKIPFHISTQASISNPESALFFKKLGAKKIVLARELNLKQIKEISKTFKGKPEIECFCHGAMCVSISGRCFMSQHLHGLSANRGECAQPCRRAYKITEEGHPENELVLDNNRVMSAKDMCTLPFIEQMKKAGITSFKIEGRNRNPEYVYTTVKEYRKALDKNLSKEEITQSLEELKKVYNRGFSNGFYLGLPTSDDISKAETGEQTETKIFIGKIFKYWPKISVAEIQISNNGLKLGDEIYITSDKTGIVRTKIESIQMEHKSLEKANKGDKIGIKVPKCNEGDEVYLIKIK